MDHRTPTTPAGLNGHANINKEQREITQIRPIRRTKPWAIGFGLMALSYMIWAMLPSSGWMVLKDIPREPTINLKADKKLVPLEAHIMSKCPDTVVCLRELVLPTVWKPLLLGNYD